MEDGVQPHDASGGRRHGGGQVCGDPASASLCKQSGRGSLGRLGPSQVPKLSCTHHLNDSHCPSATHGDAWVLYRVVAARQSVLWEDANAWSFLEAVFMLTSSDLVMVLRNGTVITHSVVKWTCSVYVNIYG